MLDSGGFLWSLQDAEFKDHEDAAKLVAGVQRSNLPLCLCLVFQQLSVQEDDLDWGHQRGVVLPKRSWNSNSN